MDPRQAAREGAELRLRPIMMTMLVATLGLLPAAMSHDIGSNSQRPFAISSGPGPATNCPAGMAVASSKVAGLAFGKPA